jgi:hypothetical protein
MTFRISGICPDPTHWSLADNVTNRTTQCSARFFAVVASSGRAASEKVVDQLFEASWLECGKGYEAFAG